MRVVTVARKPLSESTVASNVTKHACGALNINASRIRSGPIVGGSTSGEKVLGMMNDDGWVPRERVIDRTMVQGRWPANLILVHRPGCRETGMKSVRASLGGTNGPTALGRMNDDGWVPKPTPKQTYADASGMGIVPSWECAPDCPVRELDEHSGDRPVSGAAKTGWHPDTVYEGQGSTYIQAKRTGVLHNDSGGASRFFKQVKP